MRRIAAIALFSCVYVVDVEFGCACLNASGKLDTFVVRSDELDEGGQAPVVVDVQWIQFDYSTISDAALTILISHYYPKGVVHFKVQHQLSPVKFPVVLQIVNLTCASLFQKSKANRTNYTFR